MTSCLGNLTTRRTNVAIEQAGVPTVSPAEMCYLGWQESLILFAKLVEAETPD